MIDCGITEEFNRPSAIFKLVYVLHLDLNYVCGYVKPHCVSVQFNSFCRRDVAFSDTVLAGIVVKILRKKLLSPSATHYNIAMITVVWAKSFLSSFIVI